MRVAGFHLLIASESGQFAWPRAARRTWMKKKLENVAPHDHRLVDFRRLRERANRNRAID